MVHDDNSELGLAGKVAIVTGAGAAGEGIGNGRAAAILLARAGAKVLCVDLRAELARRTAQMITEEGGSALAHAADVSDEGQCRAMVERALESYGRLDLLDNNVGIQSTGSVVQEDPERWRELMRVNVDSVFLCSRHAIPAMLRSAGGGAIVNVASIMGTVGTRGAVPYGAAKGGVVNLTRCSAMDCAPESIRVNAICPGYLEDAVSLGDTTARTRNMAELIAKHPLGRLARTSEVAAAIAFLASDDASFVTGACLMVDGGYTAQ